MIEKGLVPLDLTVVNQKLFQIDTGAWINAQENPSAVTYEDVFRYVAETVAEEFSGFTYQTVGEKNLPAIVYPHVHNIEWNIHLICVFSNTLPRYSNNNPLVSATISASDTVSSTLLYPCLMAYDFENEDSIPDRTRANSFFDIDRSTQNAYGRIYYDDDTNNYGTREIDLFNGRVIFKAIKYADMYFATAFFGSWLPYGYNVIQPALIFTSVLKETDNTEIPALIMYFGSRKWIKVLGNGFTSSEDRVFGAPTAFNYNTSQNIKTIAQLVFDEIGGTRYYSKSIFLSWDNNATLVTSSTDIDTDILGVTEVTMDNKRFVFVPVYSAFSSDGKALVGFLSK